MGQVLISSLQICWMCLIFQCSNTFFDVYWYHDMLSKDDLINIILQLLHHIIDFSLVLNLMRFKWIGGMLIFLSTHAWEVDENIQGQWLYIFKFQLHVKQGPLQFKFDKFQENFQPWAFKAILPTDGVAFFAFCRAYPIPSVTGVHVTKHKPWPRAVTTCQDWTESWL